MALRRARDQLLHELSNTKFAFAIVYNVVKADGHYYGFARHEREQRTYFFQRPRRVTRVFLGPIRLTSRPPQRGTVLFGEVKKAKKGPMFKWFVGGETLAWVRRCLQRRVIASSPKATLAHHVVTMLLWGKRDPAVLSDEALQQLAYVCMEPDVFARFSDDEAAAATLREAIERRRAVEAFE